MRNPETFLTEVQAVQWDGTAEGATPIIDWVLANDGTATYVCSDPVRCSKYDGDTPHWIVVRRGAGDLSGNLTAHVGEWIVRSAQGEYRVVTTDEFVANHERITSIYAPEVADTLDNKRRRKTVRNDEKNEQEPCDICSGYGCPDCRGEEDLPRRAPSRAERLAQRDPNAGLVDRGFTTGEAF